MTVLALAVLGRGLVDPAEPVVRADDDALTRGRAVFETLRVNDGRPFRLREHLLRLAGSAERVGLDPPPLEELERLAGLALAAAAAPDAVLRFYWTPGAPDADPAEEVEESWTKAAPILRAIGAPIPRAVSRSAAG